MPGDVGVSSGIMGHAFTICACAGCACGCGPQPLRNLSGKRCGRPKQRAACDQRYFHQASPYQTSEPRKIIPSSKTCSSAPDIFHLICVVLVLSLAQDIGLLWNLLDGPKGWTPNHCRTTGAPPAGFGRGLGEDRERIAGQALGCSVACQSDNSGEREKRARG